MHRLNRVGVDDFFVILSFLVRVGTFVNQLHLFEDRRLSTFSCSEEEHFAGCGEQDKVAGLVFVLMIDLTREGRKRTSHSCQNGRNEVG